MQDIYYTIHFEDDGTGEDFDEFVFASKNEATCHWAWDYPGYGRQWIKEISRQEAYDRLIEEIDRRFDKRIEYDMRDDDHGTFAQELDEYIANREPGWQLLDEVINNTNNNNYGTALLSFCEEYDAYMFFTGGGYQTREDAEKEILDSPHGGYLVRYIETLFHGIHTHMFIKVK